MSKRHDWELLNDAKGCVKVFDWNGNVNEELVACVAIISRKNVTIFFYDDHSFQVMVNDHCVYHHIV